MSDLAIRTEFDWAPLLPTYGLAVATAVAVAVVVLAYRSSAGVRASKRRVLVALRLSTLVVLAFILAGPERTTTEGRPVRDPFVVLLDASRSMRVEDGSGGTRAAEVGTWLRDRQADFAELREDYDLRFFLVGEELKPWSSSENDGDSSTTPAAPREYASAGAGGPGSGDPVPADAPTTDLGQALFSVQDALGGGRPAGVLLVSDGADRAALGRALKSGGGEAVEALASTLTFPVSVWTVGDADGPADLAVREVAAPPFGFVRRPLTFDVDLSNRALPGGTVRVTVRGEGELLAVRDVQLGEDEDETVTFEVKPEGIGYHTYRVSVPVPEGDTIPGNNDLEFTVKVVRDRTRILQVTSRPSWDVKFLRRLLKTDPNVDLVSFFILRTNEFRGELARREDLSLIAFPYEDLFSTDLQGFDLVIFQNFWFGSFANFSDASHMENLAQYVEDGGALLMIGGDFSFGEADYGRSPLGRVLPTDVPHLVEEEGSFGATLTDAGKRHPVTRLERGSDANEQRWEALPTLQGRNPLGELRPGAVSLLETEPGGATVSAVRSIGKGRTMAFANATSWRWALAGTSGPGAGRDHAEFWRGAVRWLVKDAEQRQVQVITDQENYRLGESIQVQVRVFGDDYAPLAGIDVAGSVVLVSGEGTATPISGKTDAAGQYTFGLPADSEGTRVIGVEVSAIAEPFGYAEARVTVTDRNGELENPRIQPELMAALAEATGGEVLPTAPDPRDAARKPADSLLATDRHSDPLWSQPALLLLLVLPLGAEWVLRRRLGLR